jgi:pimeloyl-ACP methyl ester carboxylesterase
LFRPPQPPTPAPGEFVVERSVVRDDLALAYVREGVGTPVLLLHGYPETKRIWWRNMRRSRLRASGHRPGSPPVRRQRSSPDDVDLAVYSRDVHALVHDVLGHPQCAVLTVTSGASSASTSCTASTPSSRSSANTVPPRRSSSTPRRG